MRPRSAGARERQAYQSDARPSDTKPTDPAYFAAFARRLAEEHDEAEAALKTAADGSGAQVSAALDQDRLVTALRGKSGADFENSYVADQVAVLSNALTLYGDYMLLGANEKLKALAIKMIPIVEAQLKVAQVLLGN